MKYKALWLHVCTLRFLVGNKNKRCQVSKVIGVQTWQREPQGCVQLDLSGMFLEAIAFLVTYLMLNAVTNVKRKIS